MKQFAAIVLVSLLFAAVAVSAHAVTIERTSVTTSDGVRRYFIARPPRQGFSVISAEHPAFEDGVKKRGSGPTLSPRPETSA